MAFLTSLLRRSHPATWKSTSRFPSTPTRIMLSHLTRRAFAQAAYRLNTIRKTTVPSTHACLTSSIQAWSARTSSSSQPLRSTVGRYHKLFTRMSTCDSQNCWPINGRYSESRDKQKPFPYLPPLARFSYKSSSASTEPSQRASDAIDSQSQPVKSPTEDSSADSDSNEEPEPTWEQTILTLLQIAFYSTMIYVSMQQILMCDIRVCQHHRCRRCCEECAVEFARDRGYLEGE